MKKLIMVVMLLAGIGLAGGGYYMFFIKPQQDAELAKKNKKKPPEVEEKTVQEAPEKAPPAPEITEFYVSPQSVGVRNGPSYDAFINDRMYRGEKLKILEKKDGWGRISRYYVYKHGGNEEADWVPMAALITSPPVVSKEERQKTLMSFIGQSDDFKLHESMFLKQTDKLLKSGQCRPHDFQELRGWVRSIRYRDREVYFVYCGGIDQNNKIYLDVKTGKTFE